MSEYRYPFNEIVFNLSKVADFSRLTPYLEEEVGTDLLEAILGEAGKLAEQVIAPLNQSGDEEGSRVVQGEVHEAKGFKEAFKAYAEGGWASLAGATEYGGQGLPFSVAAAVNEGVQSANLAFSLCPLLSQGAIEAIETHAEESLKQAYLPKMISGEWTGTMNLTEPDAGSDLAAIRCKAMEEGDHFRIKGQKIFITWGDHQMTDNVIHLVLARLPDAPEGVKGISLFIVPKFLLDEQGNPAQRNDVTVVSVEKKLGIHASPTCVMSFGENDGAVGYLVGQRHQGLMAMFTMMNNARQGVGLQGLAISERAYQQALDYAKERLQGTGKARGERVAIIQHPDVKRMLMTMKSQIDAMRSLVYCAAVEVDLANLTSGEDQKAHQERVNLLTPIVKGWITEQAQEITSLAIQVHGGVGFIEETGVAQHARDARILPIYEGTNGIQSLDLIGRKMTADQGAGLNRWLDDMASDLSRFGPDNDNVARVVEALRQVRQAMNLLLERMTKDPIEATGSAYYFMMLLGYTVGGWLQVRAADLSFNSDENDAQKRARQQSMNFYCTHILPRAALCYRAIVDGDEILSSLEDSSFDR